MTTDTLSQTFAALADPTRRAMLARLAKGEANVSQLAEPFLEEMSLPAITKHIKVLERAGLLTKTVDAQFRPCKINDEALKDVADWMQEYRQFWEESFDRLGDYLKTVKAAAENAPRKVKKKSKAKSKTKSVPSKSRTTVKDKSKGYSNGRK